jgi:hypothetical protein
MKKMTQNMQSGDPTMTRQVKLGLAGGVSS